MSKVIDIQSAINVDLSIDMIDHIRYIGEEMDFRYFRVNVFSPITKQFQRCFVQITKDYQSTDDVDSESQPYSARIDLVVTENPQYSALCMKYSSIMHPRFVDLLYCFPLAVFVKDVSFFDKEKEELISDTILHEENIDAVKNACTVLSDFLLNKNLRIFGPILKRKSSSLYQRAIAARSFDSCIGRMEKYIYLYNDEIELCEKGLHPIKDVSFQKGKFFSVPIIKIHPATGIQKTVQYLTFYNDDSDEDFRVYKLNPGDRYLQLVIDASITKGKNQLHPKNAAEIFRELENKKVCWREVVKRHENRNL